MTSQAQQLSLPVSAYAVEGYRFGERVRSRIILWARHLGDDVILPPGTPVHTIAAGKVVWSEVRAGSEVRRNWGGVVIVEHIHKSTGQLFYSVYGHLTNLKVVVGEEVAPGALIGEVAPGRTPENGWWKTPHLHFGIYLGPWTDCVLPGYKRFFDGRTRFSWWRDPRSYIEAYNRET